MLMRFDPFAELDRRTGQRWTDRSGFMPADAYRLGDRFWLHLDLPGVDPDSIDLTVDKKTLTVGATREWAREEGTQVLLSERPTGRFSRKFFLGEALGTDRIVAGYDHGVLTVSNPVAETAKPRRIEIGMVHEALDA